MPALVRSSAPRGARFYEDGDKVMFINVLDATTRFGPHEATQADMDAHPKAMEDFLEGKPVLPPGSAPLVTFEDPPEGRPEPAPLKVRKEA